MSIEFAAVTPPERHVLSPTGALRVGLYSGSPTSHLAAGEGKPERGVGYLLGRELARWLAVPFEPVIHPRNAELLKAVRSDEVDLVFTNASNERAKYIHFSRPLLALEKSVLVPTESAARTLGDVTSEGSRIGFSAGSSTAVEFGLVYPDASLVAVHSLAEAALMLADAALDGFATNKAILCQVAEAMGGGRILDGAWGVEHLALGIPISRGAGLPCLQRFAAWAEESGVLGDAIARSGLRAHREAEIDDASDRHGREVL
jgi:polar amino acid transport system substrate-binding protein